MWLLRLWNQLHIYSSPLWGRRLTWNAFSWDLQELAWKIIRPFHHLHHGQLVVVKFCSFRSRWVLRILHDPPLILHDPPRSYTIPLDPTWSPSILHDPPQSYMIPLDPTWSPLILHDPPWSYTIPLDPTWSPLILHDPPWSFMIPLDPTWPPWSYTIPLDPKWSPLILHDPPRSGIVQDLEMKHRFRVI